MIELLMIILIIEIIKFEYIIFNVIGRLNESKW